jgi:predicted RNA-binding Zn-ribbon protein involved in translation (DUF1610 family)
MKTKDPEEIFINDAKLVCNQCEFEQFYSSKYNPGKDGLNFIGLDWMSSSVDVFICSRCGFFHWFASTLPSENPVSTLPPETSQEGVSEKDPEKDLDPSECVSCGKLITAGLDHCPSCGWTYK